ncbi:MOSC domain-containing protein [Phenylobacterium sp. 20VBR1]|uniref:MOSC domain-containing protein n=1 Tax=Phenylobacterium glaciei TaxID=2803784 RepID=A0A941HUF0_9CAUL|nr:MOSC domain-containing protein [Phenylobacterium glaciei]MBR7618589.1 MOSC domain-containing protein [Phenylobacterium glaciei]
MDRPMLNPDSPLARLMTAPVRAGSITWIGLRPAAHAPMTPVPSATLVASQGMEGDRYRTRNNGGRQVTLIQAEDLAAIASYLGRDAVGPEALRRNIVVRGINLLALKEKRFRLGGALLAYSGECHPCSRMEAILGTGGYNAVRGHGGITARILDGGAVRVGDSLEVLPAD